jgi:hypothetical protein
MVAEKGGPPAIRFSFIAMDGVARIQQITAQNLAPRTKKAYSSYNRMFKRYIQETFPDFLSNGEIDVSKLTLQSFQLFLVLKREEGKAFSTLSVRLCSLRLSSFRPNLDL